MPFWRRFSIIMLILILVKNLNGQITDWKRHTIFRGKVASCIIFEDKDSLPDRTIYQAFNKDGYLTNVTKIEYKYFNDIKYKHMKSWNTYYADTQQAEIVYDTFNRVVRYYENNKVGLVSFEIGIMPPKTKFKFSESHKKGNKSAATTYIHSGDLIQLAERIDFNCEELAFDRHWAMGSNAPFYNRLPLASTQTIQITNIKGWRGREGSELKSFNEWDSSIYKFRLINGFGKCTFKEQHSSPKYDSDSSFTQRFIRTGDSCSNFVFVNGSWIYGNRYSNIHNRKGQDITHFRKVRCYDQFDNDLISLKKRLIEIKLRNAELRQCGLVDSALLPTWANYRGNPKYEFDECGNWIKWQVFDSQNGKLIFQQKRDIKYYTD